MYTSNFTIKCGYGKYTYLDKIYTNFLNNSLINSDLETAKRWKLYDTIMSEFLEHGMVNVFEETKYRLTGNECPNDVLLDIMNRDEMESLFDIYKSKIQEFIDDDNMKRFL